MNIFCLLLLLTFGGMGHAESLNILWRVQFTDAQGKAVKHTDPIPTGYISVLERCGHKIDLHNRADRLPVATLDCPGLLDFSKSGFYQSMLKEGLANLQNTTSSASQIEKIIAEISKVRFAHSPYGIFVSSENRGRFRHVALNIAKIHLVILNPHFLNQIQDKELLLRILLHEALGALGYEDQDYQISSSLFLKKNRQWVGNGSGASVVGRGGDSDQMAFKLSLVRALQKPFDFQIEGVRPQDLPTKDELEEAVEESQMLSESLNFFAQSPGLCTDLDRGVKALKFCGGFLLNGPSGKPVILISAEWGSFDSADATALLRKVLTQMVFAISQRKAGRP